MIRSPLQTMAAGLPAVQAKSAGPFDALTWQALFGAPTSKAGVSVNMDSALQVSTFLAGTRVLAEGVAQLPLKVFREADDESLSPARDVAAYDLLYRQPNDWQTSFEFRETMMFHAVTAGNAYAIKNTLKGEVRELLPVRPGTYTEELTPDYGFVLHVNDPYGRIGTFTRDQLFHIAGPSWNSVLGMNAMRLAREALGLAIATEETHASLHANGARPGGLITVDGSLSDIARARVKAQLGDHQGVTNAFRTMIMDKGASWTPFAMTGVDAQHLDTRRFQIEEICRFLRVFPQMVGYADKTATFASAESFFLAHVIHSLMPWLERWEQAIARDIFGRRSNLVARFNTQGLLRGDAKSRAEYYASGILNGWLTRNEARRHEGMNPLAGLDTPLTPLNMADAAAREKLTKAIHAAVAEIQSLRAKGALNDEQLEFALEHKIAGVLAAA